MKTLKKMVEEKGIEPSTFALRMLPQPPHRLKSMTYAWGIRPEMAHNGHSIARTVHRGIAP